MYRICFPWFVLVLTIGLVLAGAAGAEEVQVGDAFVRAEAGGARWVIGTAAVEQTFDSSHDQLRLISYRNKLTQPATEYVTADAACAPFGLEVGPLAGRFAFEELWGKTLASPTPLDLAAEGVTVKVAAGDRIGFWVTAAADAALTRVAWPSEVAYAEGPTFTSADDTKLDQGPVWFYYQRGTGSACLEELGETCDLPFGGAAERCRVATGYRAPPEAIGVGGRHFSSDNAFLLLRVWQAPQAGTVTLRGQATLVGGSSARLGIVRITELAERPRPLPADFNAWKLEQAEASEVSSGGRPAAQLAMTLRRGPLRARARWVAFPGTSVLRQWVTLENTGVEACSLKSPAPLMLGLEGQETAAYTQYWLAGGTSRPNQGLLDQAAMGPAYHHALLGEKSDNLVPWTAWLRRDGRGDGSFVALDYLGTWNVSLDRAGDGPLRVSISLPTLADYPLKPQEALELPVTTLGVFRQNLDDLGSRLYDWQYEYLWDLVNPDYFARTKWVAPIYYAPPNLQEQFTGRLALDMDADLMRSLGMEMLWEDAGWSKYPGWPIPDSYSTFFVPSLEGPDFAETHRYLRRMDMTWLAWIVGRPSLESLQSLVGAWGSFQWRTDGVGRFGWEADRQFRRTVEAFLARNPRASFHTCDGGSRYAHQFDVQRLADVNYLSDMGRGGQIHHYLSYLEVPDRWLDMIDVLQQNCKVDPDTAPGQLTVTPTWYIRVAEEDREPLRHLMELYRYLRREGVAGRWSYMMHPRIEGDAEHFYDQRTSHDRTRACILRKHKPEGDVVVFPQGLLPEHTYTVGFESGRAGFVKTGAALMAEGIAIPKGTTGELVYLNLPNRPGSRTDTVAPQAPAHVLVRQETNLGHTGVALYWSPGADNNWISYYEVRRGQETIGKAAIGNYYFDHAPGWNPQAPYAVRTVDGDGNTSDWVAAGPLAGGCEVYATLGAHGPEAGRDGWRAESSRDGQQFAPMTWVPAAKSPAADLGGTPNQRGGVEGYWESPGTARIGRGWQLASAEEACVRAWTAPHAGTLRVVGRAMHEYYHRNLGGPLRVKILQNQKQLWPAEDWAVVGGGDSPGAAHDVKLDVAAGDTLRFVLDKGTTPEHDLLAWMPRIEYQGAESRAPTSTVVRILCGSATAYTDHCGNVWSADQFFAGGEPTVTRQAIEEAAPTREDQPLYQAGRRGRDFSYAIPVPPGLYAVRLKLAEPNHTSFFERPMNLAINGLPVLEDFDILQRAKAPRRALERAFRHIVPNADGQIVLHFSAGHNPLRATDDALVQAIEVVPDANPTIRINAGSPSPWIDWSSHVWSADQNFDGGATLASTAPVAMATPTLYDAELYRTARTGKAFRYTVAVPAGVYTVHLKLAELWLSEPGQRPMEVRINGRAVTPFPGPPGMALDLRADEVTPDGDGRLSIELRATGNHDALLQGLEIE